MQEVFWRGGKREGAGLWGRLLMPPGSQVGKMSTLRGGTIPQSLTSRQGGAPPWRQVSFLARYSLIGSKVIL
ncbi:MAG: hypothetical protein BGO12_19325 [Verrucomicrobia bacterium 61-8]|nr:MAG: hypothetical protein BGO12_19325 [Verrucomicrobia bacterium 61-8]